MVREIVPGAARKSWFPTRPGPPRLLLEGAAGLGHIGLDQARELEDGDGHLRPDGSDFRTRLLLARPELGPRPRLADAHPVE
jgi:hypothetical protein